MQDLPEPAVHFDGVTFLQESVGFERVGIMDHRISGAKHICGNFIGHTALR